MFLSGSIHGERSLNMACKPKPMAKKAKPAKAPAKGKK
jgi:hypothetical protein